MKKYPHVWLLWSLAFPSFGFADEGADAFSKEVAKIFAEVDEEAAKGNQGPDLDRTRGRLVFEAEDGRYEKGAHFGKWYWDDFTGERWGNYAVKLTYASKSPKMGFQFYIGEQKSKGYLGPTAGMEDERTALLSPIYLPDGKAYPVGILSGDDSNGPMFQLRRVILEPAPEGEAPTQAIDGTVTLGAGQATTFARAMRYEPKEAKDCLGYWTEVDDWAEWNLPVHMGGTFRVELSYGCGGGNEGSVVHLWVNDTKFAFTVEDTGGFQSWKKLELGEVDLKEGRHRVVIKPENKTGKAILDVEQVRLLPVNPAS